MGKLPARLAAVVMAVLLVACSGGSDGDSHADSGDDSGGGAAASSSPAAEATVATTRPVDTSFTGRGSDAYCGLARNYADASGRLGESATADLRQIFRDAARDVRQAVDVAPGEIRSDVRVVADGFNALVEGLERVDYDYTRLPPDLVVRFMSAEFVTASTRLSAYNRDVCGIAE